MTKTAARGSDLNLGAQTAAAHGFEALVKSSQKKCTPVEQGIGREPCRRRLDVGDTITLMKLIPCLQECYLTRCKWGNCSHGGVPSDAAIPLLLLETRCDLVRR
jgi:hypothetical protein